MKKLTLDLDRLVVDSFEADVVTAEEGTVYGEQQETRRGSCLRTLCCPHTYDPSCADTCTC